VYRFVVGNLRQGITSEYLGMEDILDLKRMGGQSFDSSSSGQGQAMGHCEHSNKPLVSTNV
jgi:hypothetical protein